MIYAGYIQHEPWGISRRKGHHEPIISLETFEKIQARRNTRAVAPRRKDISEDFPLRGAVVCACCEQAMTSCWSKSGTGKRYPYFFCQNQKCEDHRKNIRAEKIDSGFEAILRGMTPSTQLLTIAIAMLKDAWAQRMKHAVHNKAALTKQLAELEKQQDGLIERLVEANNPKVGAALERKIAKLEDEKLLVRERQTPNDPPHEITPELIELLERFLSNPWKIYEKGTLSMKKTILNMAFKAPLAYDHKTGYRTPQPSVIFDFFENITSKCKMVRSRGH